MDPKDFTKTESDSTRMMEESKTEAEEYGGVVTRYSRLVDDVKSENSTMSEEDLLAECKYHSLVFGAVVGCFIQLSCVGAFFVYSKLTHGQDHSIWTFSLVWSAFTSLIGLGIMVVLSLLFRRTSSNEHVLLQLELYLSSGAVIGVSLTWVLKNICMGVPDVAWQSFLSITLALCYIMMAKKLVQFSAQDTETDFMDDSSKPLLETTSLNNTNVLLKTRRLGYVLGSLIGCLVQISSLAAHHVFLQYRETLVPTESSNSALLLLCVAWDLLTCSLGVAALLLVRKLLLLQIASPTNEEKRHLFVFEACFCIGALFGVNICWMVTDMLLGLHALLCKTIVTLAISLLMYWWSCTSREDDDYDEDCEETEKV